jgi:transcription termination factor Rho
MFEISQLKDKKLSDLQEIAQKLDIPKYRTLKKQDLIYQILDKQAANPKVITEASEPTLFSEDKSTEEKKPRARVQKAVPVTQPKKEEKPAVEATVIETQTEPVATAVPKKEELRRLKNNIKKETTINNTKIKTKIRTKIRIKKMVMWMLVIKTAEIGIVNPISSLMP